MKWDNLQLFSIRLRYIINLAFIEIITTLQIQNLTYGSLKLFMNIKKPRNPN